ncbi:Uncharacterized protein Adt_42477 [Abeliophyllum distichum]|uniref:Uncharacterized protein n=1 Tax=Abeliophyllum distichum TaxID=126358 RepID=A0ABD1PRS6_9LAMI
MVASYILWVFTGAGGNLTPREFESIYRPCQSSGWYNVSPRPGQKWGTATDILDKVHNWNERFFFVGGDWEFIPEDPLLHVSISRRFGKLATNPEEEPRRAQLSSLKGFMCFVSPVPPVGRVLPHKLPGMRRRVHHKEVQDATPSKEEGFCSHGGLMRDARKVRRTEEGHRSSPSLDREPKGAGNSASSAGQNRRIRISERREELPTSVMEMLPAHPLIVAVSVYRYWTPSREKVAEEATVLERVAAGRDYKSKKLAEDLKVMGIEKAQLNSDKRALQFKLDLVVSKEADMKVKYEIELKATKECLK